jgi:(1->4)-alpha-D-glucan 1-alpha-D-glucosylmutase
VGTWPIRRLDEGARQKYVERIVLYLDKALREAKLHTSWLNPYQEYDQAVASFIRTILSDIESPFVADLDTFVRSISDAGFVNSLAQTLIKICVPGVPDFYQGVEFWDFNLVDPDNRGPVDFATRRQMLEKMMSCGAENLPRLAGELLRHWPDERLKMFVTWRALQFRRAHPELFQGDYVPLAADGPLKAQLCAFARVAASEWAVCIAPRLTCQVWREFHKGNQPDRTQVEPRWPPADWWKGTVVPLPPEAPGRWRHVITGQLVHAVQQEGAMRVLDASDVLRCFPVALLTPDAG